MIVLAAFVKSLASLRLVKAGATKAVNMPTMPMTSTNSTKVYAESLDCEGGLKLLGEFAKSMKPLRRMKDKNRLEAKISSLECLIFQKKTWEFWRFHHRYFGLFQGFFLTEEVRARF